MALHYKMLIGIAAGAAAGLWLNGAGGIGPDVQWWITNLTEPLGRVWVNALVMAVIPLAISAIVLAVAALGSATRLASVAGLTLVCFVALSVTAAVLGLGITQLLRPGAGLGETARQQLMETYQGESSQAMGLARGGLTVETLVNIVPRNPVQALASGELLPAIVIALMIGAALTQLPRPKVEPLLSFLDSAARVAIRVVEIVMTLAPLAVALLVFNVAARLGFDVVRSLASFALTVAAGLAWLLVLVYPAVLSTLARRSPMAFFRETRLVLLTAFSTASSAATLPTALTVTEQRLHVPPEIAGFVVPLGATLNLHGTALFQAATVMFLAQVFGIELTFGQQALVVVMTVATAMIAAAVPVAPVALLLMVLDMVGIPMEAIALVLGIDRALEMCRTAVSVAGDMVTAVVVQRYAGVSEGIIL